MLESVETCPICGKTMLEPFLSHKNTQWFRDQGYRFRCSWAMCMGCGLLIQSPRVRADKMQALYTSGYRASEPACEYLDAKRKDAEDKISWIRGILGPGGSRSALDIGCAEGTLPAVLREHQWDAFGIEPTLDYAKWGRARFGLRIESEELSHRSFGGRRFDLLSLSHLLEHLYAPETFLRLAAERLGPGGYLFVEVPDAERPQNDGTAGWLSIDHAWAFSRDTLAALLARSGYDAVRVESCLGPRGGVIRGLWTRSTQERLPYRSAVDPVRFYSQLRKCYRLRQRAHFRQQGWKDATLSGIRAALGPAAGTRCVALIQRTHRRARALLKGVASS